MIFYFSATGNSKWAAEKLAAKTCDKVISIVDALHGDASCDFTLKAGEKIGFVFPVHGWRVPSIVREFISRLKLHNYHESTYTYALCTCGDSAGEIMKLLAAHLADAHLHLNASYTIIMPESYIGLPFMYLDKELRECEKIRNATIKLDRFSEWISESRGGEHLDKGLLPSFYSGFLGGFFHNYLVTDKHFSVDANKCIGCGKCAKVCPVEDIECQNGDKPVWQHNGRCMTCYACLHHCPTNAISWGWFTSGKGQYVRKMKN
jgi:NAD-dependent dihydropyrimidine dehydrogenase PreA subunit